MQPKVNSINLFQEKFRESLSQTALFPYTKCLNSDTKFALESPDRIIQFTEFAIHQNEVPIALDLSNAEHEDKAISGFIKAFYETIIHALFAKVSKKQESDLTYASDGVLTVDATSGLVEEKFEEAVNNFEQNGVSNSLCFGMSPTELRELWDLKDLHNQPAKFTCENHKVKYFGGAEIIEIQGGFLECNGGVRSCFALAKSAIEVHWFLEEQDRQPIFNIGAVRTNGDYVQKFITTM